MKKIWEKPKLVVLYRAKPGENVLGYCKASPYNGPAVFVDACFGTDELTCLFPICEEDTLS